MASSPRPASTSARPTTTTRTPAPRRTAATGCGDSTGTVTRHSCAEDLQPWEAALLAGMVANPSAFDPIAHPAAATARRNVVLSDMLKQGYISQSVYDEGVNAPLPTAADIEQPEEPPAAPYFTSWLRPQILSAMGLGHGVSPQVAEYRAYYGGLKIRTTIDLPMQQAAEAAVRAELPSGPDEPTASLVAIDNKTGQVRAMVGGPLVNGVQDYEKYPFNLATEGNRQPGSAFKPFTLAVGLEHGYGPDSVFDSHPFTITVPNSGGKEHYSVKNFGGEYSGPITLADATDVSDNTRLHPARAGRRHQEDRQDGEGDGDPNSRLDQPRDDHRRPQAGRHHPGHGPRVRDDRRGRAPRLLADPGRPIRGPDGHRADAVLRRPLPR